MLKEERQQIILQTLQKDGKVLAGELSKVFDVSEDTIRRDLRELASAGKLQRVHGGGLPHSPAEGNFNERLHLASAAKAAIAQAAVNLIENGQVVIFDGGTTNFQLAQRLPSTLSATVITNSPIIAATLASHPRVEVLVIGGHLYKESQVTIGTATVNAFKDVRADLCFLGVCSLHPDAGISIPDSEEVHVKRAMIASSDQVIALASADKLDTASHYIVGPLSCLHRLITEAGVSEDILEPYRLAGLQIDQI